MSIAKQQQQPQQDFNNMNQSVFYSRDEANDESLPLNFWSKIIELEKQLKTEEVTIERIEDLIIHYRQALEYFDDNNDDKQFSHYKKKMKDLHNQMAVLEVLDKQPSEPKQSVRSLNSNNSGNTNKYKNKQLNQQQNILPQINPNSICINSSQKGNHNTINNNNGNMGNRIHVPGIVNSLPTMAFNTQMTQFSDEKNNGSNNNTQQTNHMNNSNFSNQNGQPYQHNNLTQMTQVSQMNTQMSAQSDQIYNKGKKNVQKHNFTIMEEDSAIDVKNFMNEEEKGLNESVLIIENELSKQEMSFKARLEARKKKNMQQKLNNLSVNLGYNSVNQTPIKHLVTNSNNRVVNSTGQFLSALSSERGDNKDVINNDKISMKSGSSNNTEPDYIEKFIKLLLQNTQEELEKQKQQEILEVDKQFSTKKEGIQKNMEKTSEKLKKKLYDKLDVQKKENLKQIESKWQQVIMKQVEEYQQKLEQTKNQLFRQESISEGASPYKPFSVRQYNLQQKQQQLNLQHQQQQQVKQQQLIQLQQQNNDFDIQTDKILPDNLISKSVSCGTSQHILADGSPSSFQNKLNENILKQNINLDIQTNCQEVNAELEATPVQSITQSQDNIIQSSNNNDSTNNYNNSNQQKQELQQFENVNVDVNEIIQKNNCIDTCIDNIGNNNKNNEENFLQNQNQIDNLDKQNTDFTNQDSQQ